MSTARKILVPLLYVGLGVLLTVGVELAWLFYVGTRHTGTRQPSVEDLSASYLKEQTTKEQNRRGIKCAELRSALEPFLVKDLGAAFGSRPPGKDWRPYIAGEQTKSVLRHVESVRFCSTLYTMGEKGRKNGLEDLAFVDDVLQDLSLIDMYLNFGPGTPNCSSTYIDDRFNDMEEARRRILAALKRPPGQAGQ